MVGTANVAFAFSRWQNDGAFDARRRGDTLRARFDVCSQQFLQFRFALTLVFRLISCSYVLNSRIAFSEKAMLRVLAGTGSCIAKKSSRAPENIASTFLSNVCKRSTVVAAYVVEGIRERQNKSFVTLMNGRNQPINRYSEYDRKCQEGFSGSTRVEGGIADLFPTCRSAW